MSKPNIIICMCDELRAFEVACYGHPHIKTPNMDRLAAAGTRFEIAASNNPVCMPARSIVLSGQYSSTCNGILGNKSWTSNEGQWIMPHYPEAGRPHLKDKTLAESLKESGYHTTAIGKWHINSWPDDIGFDHYIIPRHQHANRAQLFTEDGGEEFCPDMSFCVLVPPIILRARRLMLMEDAL
ncbi:MAG: sulfatase-like hydrolase/transferase [Lentisphaeria bacterium]|nr:sulfatase-like hydrolase/transferase [Lentisphaeria bacterium]NQZ67557.1 sulfatase-like hydrolase/transferase [Lentisphaeria bacterium]